VDDAIPAYRRVADALHAEGVKFVVQLNHMGGEGSSRPFGGVLKACVVKIFILLTPWIVLSLRL
jgi:2,4-dienoyl-CoA reductase-like NADH-dependent reductase (Old Yellow Enzyme family)